MGTRLDLALFERGLAPTRARARDAVLRGHVSVDGRLADKPAMNVEEAAAITVDDPASGYVSRGALKLIAGLERFGFAAKDRTALDLGASTGGFTQVLIERGARKVFAVDVGHGQLAQAVAVRGRPAQKHRRFVGREAELALEQAQHLAACRCDRGRRDVAHMRGEIGPGLAAARQVEGQIVVMCRHRGPSDGGP